MDDAHFPSLWAHVSGKRVLEIGCGTGRHTRRLVEAGNCVTAVEPSEGMLAIAQRKVPHGPHGPNGKVEFIHADFLKESQVPSDSFDSVIISLVLEHIEELYLFFQKAARHLKADGKLYLSEIHPERIAGGSQAHFLDAKSGQVVRLESFAHTPMAIEDAAKSANLVLLETRDIFGSVELSKQHSSWSKYLGKPMIKIWSYAKL